MRYAFPVVTLLWCIVFGGGPPCPHEIFTVCAGELCLTFMVITLSAFLTTDGSALLLRASS